MIDILTSELGKAPRFVLRGNVFRHGETSACDPGLRREGVSLGLVLKPRELLLLVASQAVKDCHCRSGLKERKCKTASMWPCLFADVNVVEGVRGRKRCLIVHIGKKVRGKHKSPVIAFGSL